MHTRYGLSSYSCRRYWPYYYHHFLTVATEISNLKKPSGILSKASGLRAGSEQDWNGGFDKTRSLMNIFLDGVYPTISSVVHLIDI